ncbi:MAG: hypothetical protein RKR03_05395 [Candidatus Competibacter sp.]|nr:hypothetical protein [Candidatus Contendobacter sp.]MDG4557719.1 hypothetical protein [Candidatus Contendobacter sp.]MDS4019931.1 hypothetical protein [Candidatus Competibacter sp.]
MNARLRPGSAADRADAPWKDLITDAIRYWEPMRLVYNGVLAVLVLVWAWPVLPSRWSGEWQPALAVLFVLAVAANVAYCAAYPVDVFLQCSEFRATWQRYRWVLFVAGLLTAAALTWLVLAVLLG